MGCKTMTQIGCATNTRWAFREPLWMMLPASYLPLAEHPLCNLPHKRKSKFSGHIGGRGFLRDIFNLIERLERLGSPEHKARSDNAGREIHLRKGSKL